MVYRDQKYIDPLLCGLYRLNSSRVKKLVRRFILRRKGAGFYSKTLRRLLLKYHGVEVGMYSMNAGDHYADLPWGTTVGRYCSLSKGLLVINGSHPVGHKSTHAFFYNPALGYVDELLIERRTRLDIGHDVYMGLNVTILPNVTSIGTGAVIAAGSVVTKDVPPFAVLGGNPAKLIRFRFKPETIEKILASRWWEKAIEELTADEAEFMTFLQPLEEV